MQKIYVLLILFSSLFVSCDDYLDIPPKNVITVQGVEDIKKLVGSYLEKMEQKEMFRYNMFMVSGPEFWGSTEAFRYYEDDLDFSGMFFMALETAEEGKLIWKDKSYQNGIWNSLYSYIGDFNLYLYEIERVDDGVSLEMNAIKAEVLMNRALYYFRLVQYFCPYKEGQYVTDPEVYGLPILKSVEDLATNYYPQRLNQQETYEFILNDLKQIEELNVEANDFNFIYNKRAFYGLMAELYMWKAESPAKEATDWENARNYALKSIDGNSMVATQQNLQDLFNPQANSNTSALRLTLPNGFQELYRNLYASPFNVILVQNEVYDMYDANDIRRDFYINGFTKQLTKYQLADNDAKTVQPMWRVEEMQLIIAESYIREGDAGNALVALNEFKQARIPDFTSYSGSDILDEIIRERRKEFLGESNYRWCDMKRTDFVFTRVNSKGETHILEEGDYRYSFNIPSTGELDENPNNFQNPGWDLQLDEE